MKGEGGFTLLEILVATAIAAVALPVLWRSSFDSLQITRTAGAYEMAIAVAQSRLASLADNVATGPREATGHDGIFAWRMNIIPVDLARPGTSIIALSQHQDEAQAVLYTVDLEVAWSEGASPRHLHVATHRVGFAPPNNTNSP